MKTVVRWDLELERFRPLLHLQVRLMQIVPRLRHRMDFSDLVQETFRKALERLEQFQGLPGNEVVKTEGEFVRWLQKILENVIKDRLDWEFAGKRTPEREQSLEAFVESSARLENFLAGGETPPDEQAERQERLLRIAKALEQLPDDQRDAVFLYYRQGSSQKQIAVQMGRTKKAVAGLLYRALSQLRRALDTTP